MTIAISKPIKGQKARSLSTNLCQYFINFYFQRLSKYADTAEMRTHMCKINWKCHKFVTSVEISLFTRKLQICLLDTVKHLCLPSFVSSKDFHPNTTKPLKYMALDALF